MNLVDATQKALQWALYSQHARMMRLDFPHDDAPEAILLPDSLVAIERLSEDFEYSLTLLSDDPRIPLKDLTGKMINIAVPRSDGSWRDFSGYVYSAQFLDFEGTFARYRVILIPWLKFLEKRYDNYIFHNLTLEQQTGAIFDDYPTIRSWAIKLVNSEDPVRTDTIQYMETDHHFLHRHWENMGWYYWYEHNEKGHKLHLSDWSPVAKNIDGPTNRVIYRTSTGSEMEDCISDLQPIRDMASSEFNAVNFDFKAPQPKRAGIPSVNKQGTVPKMDVYKDTGLYGWRDSKMADQLVKHRMEQLEAHAKQFVGISQNPYLQPGRVFELNNDDYRAQQHDRADYTFLITGVKHTVRNNYVENAAGATYSNEFTCSRLNVPWRPALTHRHLLSNPQTAIVVGPEGEEIHTDEYGRVRVQFHWDREGKYNLASSAWIRPSAQWAGGNFGEIAIPRIDQEVIVHFLGGNPDRPIITGRIYNEKNKTPWELPSQKSLMGIRSKEIHGKGWNNLTFDDTAGKIQAQFSTTYDLTQLNMGRITRIDGTPGLKDFRGEGFELRTDSWGVVRAGKGMYISSDIRQEADQTVMDLQEAIKQLETGLMIAEKIAQATKVAGALPADVEDQQQQLDNVYLDMKKPGVLISSPQGIALTTQKSAQMSALNNVTMTAWENIDVSAYENLRANAKRSVSLFAAEDEMKIITGKDRMRLQANKNTIDIFAKKAIKVSSISDKVDINAKSKVTAAAAGGYIELTPGGIVWGAPGLISVKCADFQVMSPDNKPVSLAAFGAQMVGEVPVLTPVGLKSAPPKNLLIKEKEAEPIEEAGPADRVLDGAAVGATIGASVGAAAGPVGAVTGAIGGAIAGSVAASVADAMRKAAPTSANDLLNVPSPAEAPQRINLSSLSGDFQKAWNDSIDPKLPETIENGGTLAYRPDGTIVAVNAGTGDNGSFDAIITIPTGMTYIGTYHTHPYDDGTVGVPFSRADWDSQINNTPSEVISIVQSGDQQFLALKTALTPDHVDGAAISKTYMKAAEPILKKGDAYFTDGHQAGNKAVAKAYGIAFYEGKNGIFTKIVP